MADTRRSRPTSIFRIRRFDPTTDAAPHWEDYRFAVPAGHDGARGAAGTSRKHTPRRWRGAPRAAWASAGRAACSSTAGRAGVQHPDLGARDARWSRVAPLPNFNIIRDLVPDLVPMFEAHAAAKPYIIRDGRRRAAAADRRVLAVRAPARGVPAVLLLHQVRLLHGGVPDATRPTRSTPARCRWRQAHRYNADSRDGGFAERARTALGRRAGPVALPLRGRVLAGVPEGRGPGQGHPADEAAAGARLPEAVEAAVPGAARARRRPARSGARASRRRRRALFEREREHVARARCP